MHLCIPQSERINPFPTKRHGVFPCKNGQADGRRDKIFVDIKRNDTQVVPYDV